MNHMRISGIETLNISDSWQNKDIFKKRKVILQKCRNKLRQSEIDAQI